MADRPKRRDATTTATWWLIARVAPFVARLDRELCGIHITVSYCHAENAVRGPPAE